MNNVKRKFILYAMAALFVLLTVLLAIISVINFTIAAEDADGITQRIAHGDGVMRLEGAVPSVPGRVQDGTAFSDGEGQRGQMNFAVPDDKRFDGETIAPWGPDSADTNHSMRYFTVAFDKKGNAELKAFNISAVSEDEAVSWAADLLGGKNIKKDITGWTQSVYRYRIYRDNDFTFVTVIDQSREVGPCYRILAISFCGEAAVLLISFFVLSFVGGKLFAPLEEADRKQKRFIADVESEFKIPLTVIGANNELIETRIGSCDETAAISRQVKKMSKLVNDLGSLAIIEESSADLSECDVSTLIAGILDERRSVFDARSVKLITDIAPGVSFKCDCSALRRMFAELADNAARYAVGTAEVTVKYDGERISAVFSNGTDLPEGVCEQVFDRFVKLDNASGHDGAGLGLSFVRDVVNRCNGRADAKVADGKFIVRILL